ncbi:MAG: hypothetical protein BAA02_00730 [Paenibacillaceae bacterium ZCTH02-B3]|nr:MAG: hypothetical protein BAA02_00730 [Paenibacillaceae bacterium ZCTH02-B3]
MAGLAALAAAILLFGAVTRGAPEIAHAQENGEQHDTISVNAQGIVSVEPDVAYIHFAVEARGKTANEAQRSAAEIFAGVEKVLLETFKAAPRDIQTTGFSVYPEYNYTEREGRVLVGYVAAHSVRVTWRNLQEVGRLLDAVAAAGANRVDGVTFGTEKTDQYELEALQKAMAAAEAKAKVLAAAAKREVAGVLHIAQGSVTSIPLYVEKARVAYDLAASGSAPETSIQAGQIEIRATVSVVFKMR